VHSRRLAKKIWHRKKCSSQGLQTLTATSNTETIDFPEKIGKPESKWKNKTIFFRVEIVKNFHGNPREWDW
jgi:hypothetical protein